MNIVFVLFRLVGLWWAPEEFRSGSARPVMGENVELRDRCVVSAAYLMHASLFPLLFFVCLNKSVTLLPTTKEILPPLWRFIAIWQFIHFSGMLRLRWFFLAMNGFSYHSQDHRCKIGRERRPESAYFEFNLIKILRSAPNRSEMGHVQTWNNVLNFCLI